MENNNNTTPPTTPAGRKIKIVADKNICISAASCVAMAPKHFKLDENGKVEVIDAGTTDYDQDAVNAAMSCPVLAITIIDAETGEKIYPA